MKTAAAQRLEVILTAVIIICSHCTFLSSIATDTQPNLFFFGEIYAQVVSWEPVFLIIW